MDATDQRILNLLQADARMTLREIGERVNLTPPSVSERIHKLEDEGIIEGYRIAINRAINQIKRQRWRIVSLDFRPNDTIPEPAEEEVAAIPQEKLLAWISALPDLRRNVFNLYCIDGYSHKEIAGMLGISEKGSAGILAKARKQLKEAIIQYRKDSEK